MNQIMTMLKTGTPEMPGDHQLTLNGISWANEPTDGDFAAADVLAQTMDHAHAWAIGDVAMEYVRREQFKRPACVTRTLIAEYATYRSMPADVVKQRYMVSEFFKPEHRSTVSWAHHLSLWSAGLDLCSCIAWLKRAEKENLRADQMRAEIKRTIRPAPSNEPELFGLFPIEMQYAIDWASGRLSDVDTMPIGDAWAMLREAEPLIVYVKKLEARVCAPGKESFKPVALRR